MIKITDKSKCCGCSACASVCPKHCISMVSDSKGFLYPMTNEKECIHCNLCNQVCPVINKQEGKQPLNVYAAKNSNEEIRLKSSSGGIFTLLAEKCIQQGGVVFGAAFNKQWEVIHSYTDKMEELDRFRRSKYVQSKIGNSYVQTKMFLEQGKFVLFSGTPCQIKGLKLFLRKEYDNLLTVDVVCHGVPSPKSWRKYLDHITRNQLDSISDISFRDKSSGWEIYSLAIYSDLQKNYLVRENLNNNYYLQYFLRNYILRSSCYFCPTRNLSSLSDMTIGDFWGITETMPSFDDGKGISLVILNSEKAQTFFSDVNCNKVPSSFEIAKKQNPHLVENPVSLHKSFVRIWKMFKLKYKI